MKVKTKGRQTNTASGVSRKGGVGRFNRLCESFFELEKQHSNDTVAYIATRDAVMFSPIAISYFYHQLVRRALSSQDKSFAGVSLQEIYNTREGENILATKFEKVLNKMDDDAFSEILEQYREFEPRYDLDHIKFSKGYNKFFNLSSKNYSCPTVTKSEIMPEYFWVIATGLNMACRLKTSDYGVLAKNVYESLIKECGITEDDFDVKDSTIGNTEFMYYMNDMNRNSEDRGFTNAYRMSELTNFYDGSVYAQAIYGLLMVATVKNKLEGVFRVFLQYRDYFGGLLSFVFTQIYTKDYIRLREEPYEQTGVQDVSLFELTTSLLDLFYCFRYINYLDEYDEANVDKDDKGIQEPIVKYDDSKYLRLYTFDIDELVTKADESNESSNSSETVDSDDSSESDKSSESDESSSAETGTLYTKTDYESMEIDTPSLDYLMELYDSLSALQTSNSLGDRRKALVDDIDRHATSFIWKNSNIMITGMEHGISPFQAGEVLVSMADLDMIFASNVGAFHGKDLKNDIKRFKVNFESTSETNKIINRAYNRGVKSANIMTASLQKSLDITKERIFKTHNILRWNSATITPVGGVSNIRLKPLCSYRYISIAFSLFFDPTKRDELSRSLTIAMNDINSKSRKIVSLQSKAEKLEAKNNALQERNEELEAKLNCCSQAVVDNLREESATAKAREMEASDNLERLEREYIAKTQECSQALKELKKYKALYEEAQARVAKMDEVCSDDLMSFTEEIDALDEGVSFESKVEFLKGYRFIFIGGDKALSLRLKELGFKNFKQLCSCTEIKQLKSYDYVVVCTKFVSHKLLYKAQSEINWGGNLIYFNGSGSKALVEQIYNELN